MKNGAGWCGVVGVGQPGYAVMSQFCRRTYSESSPVYMFIILALCVVYFFLLFCIRVCEAMCIIISSGCQFAWTNVFMLLLFRFLTTIYSTRQMRVATTCSHSIHNHHWTRLLMRSYFLPIIFFSSLSPFHAWMQLQIRNIGSTICTTIVALSAFAVLKVSKNNNRGTLNTSAPALELYLMLGYI